MTVRAGDTPGVGAEGDIWVSPHGIYLFEGGAWTRMPDPPTPQEREQQTLDAILAELKTIRSLLSER
jgi:hypothetical protein